VHHASRFGDEFFSTAEVILECHLVNAAENQNSRTWAPKVRPSLKVKRQRVRYARYRVERRRTLS
jgi:hypothetical protein